MAIPRTIWRYLSRTFAMPAGNGEAQPLAAPQFDIAGIGSLRMEECYRASVNLTIDRLSRV
jgi:hypothetical protein